MNNRYGVISVRGQLSDYIKKRLIFEASKMCRNHSTYVELWSEEFFALITTEFKTLKRRGFTGFLFRASVLMQGEENAIVDLLVQRNVFSFETIMGEGTQFVSLPKIFTPLIDTQVN